MRGDRARSALRGTRFGDLRWVAETGSTNRDLIELAARGAPEGVVLVADHQVAGRGRLDRSWHAAPGTSLLMSVLLRPPMAPSRTHLLTTAVGVSAVGACRSVGDVDVLLKWPNDLVAVAEREAEGRPGQVRKLGGILAESVVAADEVSAVVGLGLNVNWPATLPPDLAGIAVALNHLAGHEVDREDLLVDLLGRLSKWCRTLYDDGGAGASELMDEARSLSATLGHPVRVDLGDERIEGEAVELTDDGQLVVEVISGGRSERRAIVSGDVVHLRPGS